jgi:hypothetical protein
LLHRLDDHGTGAERQRALFAGAASPSEFVGEVARATLAGPEPAASGARPRQRSSRR